MEDKKLLPPVVCRDVFVGLEEPDRTEDPSQRYYSQAKYMGAHCQGQKEIALDNIGPTIRSEHHGNIEYRRLSREHGGHYYGRIRRRFTRTSLNSSRMCFDTDVSAGLYVCHSHKKNSTRFELSASGAYKVIGNAVPPVLAYHIANRIQTLWPLYFKKR